jgi:hypothetical protein
LTWHTNKKVQIQNFGEPISTVLGNGKIRNVLKIGAKRKTEAAINEFLFVGFRIFF